MNTPSRVALVGLALSAWVAPPAMGQEWSMDSNSTWCVETKWNPHTVCEVRETVLPTRELLEIDGGLNGGIAVQSWDRNEIQILAKVTVQGERREWAEEALSGIGIDLGDVIEAKISRDIAAQDVAVSYRIKVPRNTNLELRTHNGGIAIRDIVGELDFTAWNGGVELVGCGGSVNGVTKNGGLHVELVGTTWEGEGLSVETTNGGIELYIPEDYSAKLITGTVNGGLRVDYPLDERLDRSKQVRTTLGDGGPLVRVVTRNGGVEVSEL
ncbi:MAG: hypothetical protein KC729_20065 [Candidatus Eisenbacteria bacterium]|uniref:DUF4097 domain-containing protein n=1 Tax=Eiseniibacteriota bacterium TaxID=2212470 RepID=A0A956M2I8_UNCEI|nr:hypothetical protein [Candidatus Eisenbacteria bacterium]